jgi:hypothetical protein
MARPEDREKETRLSMDFRTEVKVSVQGRGISYNTPVMFVGSCFAAEMAGMLKAGLMPVLSNPAGVVYNPASVATTLRNIISGRIFTNDDLWFHNNRWLSFDHYTDFSSTSASTCLDKINRNNEMAGDFLRQAGYLFITFGTARVFRRSDTGQIVSNCHKIPASFFTRELLRVTDITEEWTILLEELKRFNPDLSVIFTLSPVRHWKDGAHGNQISKAILLLAIDELQKQSLSPGYFPAYEIVMDDLRDYRFYGRDMLHPSEQAVEYISERFRQSYFDSSTNRLWNEVSELTRASLHRVKDGSVKEVNDFVTGMLLRIESLERELPGVAFSSLKDHFAALIK